MPVKQQKRETHGSFKFIYRYGSDLYENTINREFAVNDENDEKQVGRIIVANFIEFMEHTGIMSPLFLRTMKNMSVYNIKRMLNGDDNAIYQDEEEEKPKVGLEKEKKEKEEKIQQIVGDEDNLKKFVKQFNSEESGDFRKKVFEIFIRGVIDEK